MHDQDYNHAINACILGYLLVLIALFLNYAAGNKVGVLLAVLSVALDTLAETCYLIGGRRTLGYSLFSLAAAITCVWSLALALAV